MTVSTLFVRELTDDRTEVVIRGGGSVLARGSWYQDSILEYNDHAVSSVSWEGDDRIIIDLKESRGKEENSYFEELKKRLLTAAGAVNSYADTGDIKRNRVNYGLVSAWAQVMQDSGHSTNTAVWSDSNGCLRIPRISVDGEKLAEFHNGIREVEGVG